MTAVLLIFSNSFRSPNTTTDSAKHVIFLSADLCVFQCSWQAETVCAGPSLRKATPRVSPWSWPHGQHTWTGRTARTTESQKVGLVVSCEIWLFDFSPQEETGGEVASSPPESSFQKLAPSETRYTILRRDRDELWPQQPSSDPVTQCHAPGSGRGLGLGQANGTEQQHPTPLLKRERRRRGGDWRGRRRRKRRTGGGV